MHRYLLLLLSAFIFLLHVHHFSLYGEETQKNIQTIQQEKTNNKEEKANNKAIQEEKKEITYPFDIENETPLQDDKFMREFFNMLTTLGLMVAAIYGLTWALQRFTNAKIEQNNIDSAIKTIDQRAISTKTTIYLLEIEGKGIIMAESLNGATLLGEYQIKE